MKLGPNEVYRSPGRSVDVSFFSQNSVQRSGFVLQYEAGKTFFNPNRTEIFCVFYVQAGSTWP